MRINRKLAAVAAAGVLALAGPAAFADVVYNDIDTTIDSDYETMNLTFNTDTLVGTTGSTTLAIQVQGLPGHDPTDTDSSDHAGCNIQGGASYITLAPVVADPTVASVAMSERADKDGNLVPGLFDSCGDTVVVTVTALRAGSTTVDFVIDASKTNNDPSLTFHLDEARFIVNVTATTGGGPNTGCDVDPAAPAWAAAILQKSGVKANTKDWNNAVAYVAHIMTNGALYHGFVKNAHPQYENAVDADLVAYFAGKPSIHIVSAQAAARPGWLCVPIV